MNPRILLNSHFFAVHNVQALSGISHLTTLQVEEVTSDISDKFLPGILIGYVLTITPDNNNLTKSGTLIPAVDFEHMNEVLVLLDQKKQYGE